MQQEFPDCTEKCKSTQHGDIITSAISKFSISDTELCSFLNYVCTNCESVRDSAGRTALHVAASRGRVNLVTWLVKNRHANISAKDVESGYTALHRSIFYGKINIAIELIKLGASMTSYDADNLSCLEHAMKDGVKPESTIYGELYNWGSNTNHVLGPHQSRGLPEILDVFHKECPNESVLQVCLDKFHSIIVTSSGKAYSCGHGRGGRLGLGIEHTVVKPEQINFPDSPQGDVMHCVQASISRDHSVFLFSDGNILTCGLNSHNVLGLSPPPQQLLVPRPVKHLNSIKGVCTGCFHTVAWSASALYTWGLNAGQLGHKLNNNSEDKYIKTPRVVKMINLTETHVKCVAASDGATVVYTEKGDIFVLHEYQCRKIASRQLNISQVDIIGGKLNSTLDKDLSNESSKELKVVAITNTGNLFIWQETDPHLCRCIFSISRSIVIKQVSININELLFVTVDGEAFQGIIRPRKKKNPVNTMDKNMEKSAFHKFIEKEDCVSVKLTKFPRIHRALSIASDSRGRDFAVIQAFPYKLFEFGEIEQSEMEFHLQTLLDDSDQADEIHDVIFKVENRLFPAHKYIVANKSSYLSELMEDKKEISLSKTSALIFEQFLKFVYTGKCDLTKCGELNSEGLRKMYEKMMEIKDVTNVIERDVMEKSSEMHKEMTAFEYYNKIQPKEKPVENTAKNPVRMLHEMAKKFGCNDLQNALSNLDMSKYFIISKTNKEFKTRPIKFNRSHFTNFYDVTVRCRDGKYLKAHKCILAARLEYFNNMFSMRWSGSEVSEISLPFPKSVAEALLEYLYTDTLSSLENLEIDHLFKVLILADQLFVTRLKQQCELLLTNLLTLKNAVQLLNFAHVYNAEKLKRCSINYIVFNMANFLESHALEELEADLLKDITTCYFNEKNELWCRVLTPYSTAVSDEVIAEIHRDFPVNLELEIEKTQPKVSQKRRSRTHKSSTSDHDKTATSENHDNSLDNIIQFPDVPEEVNQKSPNVCADISNRVRAITLAREKLDGEDDIGHKFTKLVPRGRKISFNNSLNDSGTFLEDFPTLGSPPILGGSHSGHKSTAKNESKSKMVKISQKERKRLISDNKSTSTSAVPESPKNPWKTISNISSPKSPSDCSSSMGDIITDEKKQKENLVKLRSKLLLYTQLEDKAIVELHKFYNSDNLEEEIILIERVSLGNIASPIWVPGNKQLI